MAKVTVTIDKNGVAKIEGEGFETASLKKLLEEMGDVIERHQGHQHVHDGVEQTQQNKA